MQLTGLYRMLNFLPFLEYHHALMGLSAIAIIFFSILLAGCTSSSMSNVYLMSLSYSNSTVPMTSMDPVQVTPNVSNTFANLTSSNATLQVRVGYMAMCLQVPSREWTCSKNAETLANVVRGFNLASGGNNDPLNLIWIANNFKEHIVIDELIYTSIPLLLFIILILASFPGWHDEEDEDGIERAVKPFPSKILRNIALGLALIASLLTFMSVLWQHIASSTASVMSGSLSYGAVDGHIGTTAIVLGWAGVFLSIFIFIALLLMILNIRFLSETFEDTGALSGTRSLVDD